MQNKNYENGDYGLALLCRSSTAKHTQINFGKETRPEMTLESTRLKDRTNQSNGYSQINEEKIGGTATKIRSNGMIWADQMREHGQRDDNGRTAKNDRGDGVGRTATQKPTTWDDNGRTATQKPARWDVSAEQQNGNTGTRQQKQETARKVTRLVMTTK
ncbi:hypothetical protein DAPPUDRAFT_119984 [Daphnia pulex]|uniref:Uncharacterized protein n=1 Tax=Daphnia pulex TaxID=6669 RepID=E9I005_DAPPU|nr:hypothetical protein DAPPUDRAFT_119984 [Daphnia pulex]|eukprot:EFX62675.1 hypothetical protein DAPPUDRAFT_119984 [Daphnia pulex]